MSNLTQHTVVPTLVLCLGALIPIAAASAQESSSKPSSTPMTSAQQDNVTGARSDPSVKEPANDGNRAVHAARKGNTKAAAHAPTTTGATSPRPTVEGKKSPGDARGGTPVEAHSAVKENPKLPTRMPPPQGAPSAPPPNDHPETPKSP